MIFALISTFLSSMATIFYKKALSFKSTKEIFSLLSYTSVFLISFILFLFWKLKIEAVSFIIWITIIALILTVFFNNLLYQYIYRQEKISTILPYNNIRRILSIIFWYFLFSNTSLTTLLISIFTVIIIFLFTIDFKNFQIPKNIKLLAFSQTISSIVTIWVWYVLVHISNISYYVYYYWLSLIFVFLIVVLKWDFKKIFSLPKKFYVFRLWAAHFWWISQLIWFLVIKNLWVTVSVLVSYLGMWITLLFSFFLLWDKPTKKNLILTIVVTLLVLLGYYFK